MDKKRVFWIDNVKVIACIFVVLVHFYQSMVLSDLASDSIIYKWVMNTIRFFPVQLFFICSGYLYQKYSDVSSVRKWGINILNKFLALGIPYFVFSTVTWTLKRVFSSSVNSQLDGLLHTFFVEPASPYWYLYVLFFLFAITLTCKSKRNLFILFGIGLFLRILAIMNVFAGNYIIGNIAIYWIWFIAGMMMAEDLIPLAGKRIGIILLLLFALLGALFVTGHLKITGYDFIISIIACYSIISIVHDQAGKDSSSSDLSRFLIKYTMPVFLMHTLFAAPTRSLLFSLGITNVPLHIILGLSASYIGPVIAMIVLDKLHPLDFIIYPTRYIKFHV